MNGISCLLSVYICSFHFFVKSFCLLAENTNFALSVILSNRLVSMKKFFVIVTVFSVVFSSSALAQVSESLEWATRIKAEGLSRSKVDEIAQYITDYA